MRILAVAPYYEPEGGGLERYAHHILCRLAASGHEVRALAFSNRRAGDAHQDGVHVGRRRPGIRLGTSPLSLGFRGQVQAEIRRFAPDVVVGHTPVPFAAEMAESAAHRSGIPFVTTYHAGRLSGSTPMLRALAAVHRATMEHRMLRRSAHLIAASEYVRDHPLAAHRRRVTVVPPGVDALRFAPAPLPEEDRVLFLGPLSRAYRWKGVDTLWSAFRAVSAAVPTARLTLAGDGDRVPEFARLARASGAVDVLGRVPEEALVAAYHQASVVVLPSTSDAEAFGMVLAEANACCRPVVASRIGGIPDFVAHGHNGFLVRPGDAHELAQRIISLLRDKGLARRLGEAGRAKVLRDHDWAALASRTGGILTDVARGRLPDATPHGGTGDSLGGRAP